MDRIRWHISPGALLLWAAVYFFDSQGLVSALVPAALVHELGHLAAMALCRVRVRQVRLDCFGVELDYAGLLRGPRALLCLAAGPAAGICYALALPAMGLGSEYWRLSGAVSFCLSLFNLLPVLPLDGGRILLELAGERVCGVLSRVFAALAVLWGAAQLVKNHSPIPMAMGLWMMLYQWNR